MENLSSIYCQTYNFVYLRAKSILKKEEDIQQVVKEVYLKLAEETVEDDKVYEWLAKQTYVLGCQRFRTKKAREAQNIEWQSDALSIQKSVNQEKAKELICQALEELPDMYQATLYAFYYDHMNVKETAAVMGYNVGVIKNRLNYVHKYIERTFENYQEEHKEKVQFSVEIVCEALKEWSLQNKLNVVAAQNIQVALGKELNIEMQISCQEGELAGTENRAYSYVDEIQAIAEELGKYSAKKKASKKVSKKTKQEAEQKQDKKQDKKQNKKMSPVIFLLSAFVVLAIAGVLIFANMDKKETPKEPEENKTEISDNNVNQDTDLNVEEDNEDEKVENNQEEQAEEQENTSDSSYILPNSNTAKLTRTDLSGFTKEQLRLARNEIFARNGMIFGVADLDDYFGAKSWYEPKYTSSEFERNVEMTTIEEANVSLILQVESEME